MLFTFLFLINFIISAFVLYLWHKLNISPGKTGKIKLTPREQDQLKVAKRQGGFFIALIILASLTAIYFFNNPFGILAKDYWSILAAGSLIIFSGFLDDRFNLNPFYQIVFQGAAALILLSVGDTIDHIKLPFLGLVFFPAWINFLISFVWIILIINAFNWQDGLDGLAGGIGLISAIVLFCLSLTPLVAQPATAAISIIIAGTLLGFLYFNFPPARIFLGSVGSGFIGLMFAIVSIYSGGKVATAALILGIPILDFLYVSWIRFKKGRKPWQGKDREHLHYQLLDAGMNERKILFLFYSFTAIFGLLALTLQTKLKIAALISLLLIFIIIVSLIKKYAPPANQT